MVGQPLLHEVPDLVEYPVVLSGHFADEFLTLPEEVLTTTMIHHQHFFPVLSTPGKLMPVFLAVLNTEPEKPELVSRNLERVLTARLRDARFFWDADRKRSRSSGFVERLDTVLFHKALGSYPRQGRAGRAAGAWVCSEVLGRAGAGRRSRREAGRAVQGRPRHRHGARAHRAAGRDGRHLRPRGRPAGSGLEGDLPPLPAARRGGRRAADAGAAGRAAVTWAAVSLADKLDTLVGLFVAGERPTGSRDPFGLRRAAQGLVRICWTCRS